ncbi:MAG TPA: AsmA-like C-terminal region-containing protein [Vicinamibacterales bacterium]|nr:AsmA-like C-terminal region-containing protein [Vicinamibacterales bacterium]
MTRSRVAWLVPLALGVMAVLVLLSRASRATPHVRDEVVTALSERFQGDVTIDELQVGVFPRPEVNGASVTVAIGGAAGPEPLLRLGTFDASAGLLGLIGNPVRLRTVTLENLEILIPPGGLRRVRGSRASGVGPPDKTTTEERDTVPESAERPRTRLVIDEVVARAAQLRIASKDPGKLPRVFDIHDLHIFGYGGKDGSEFRAKLTNPTPRGLIRTTGRFGPWQARGPRTTPLTGEYVFEKADLNTIKGLGGTLSSKGQYTGVLERIEVTGDTETPDFSIDIGGRAVPLTTRFKAIVDGTNGNTYLEQVDARLFESHIHAKGSVVRTADVKGRHVTLDITIDKARIEDLLRLAAKGSKPVLTGAIRLRSKFRLPAGEADVSRRLHLDGDFSLDQARFTNFNIQERINELSKKGKGDESAGGGPGVVSRLRGRFVMNNATLAFSDLTFGVPGASVQLVGSYNLDSEALDFTGHLLLDASLRDTQSGMKAVLATVAQPFFRRKGGGSKIPIRIGGTTAKPQIGLDVKRALRPG